MGVGGKAAQAGALATHRRCCRNPASSSFTPGFQIISAVFCLHSSGFALGYLISKAMGLSEQICRTNSIEVRERSQLARPPPGLAEGLSRRPSARAHSHGGHAYRVRCMHASPCAAPLHGDLPRAPLSPAAATLPPYYPQVGMQSSALAAVLAKIHFPHDPVIVAPCVLSACTHATVGSLLAGYWSWQSSREEAAGAAGAGGTAA